jgi:hypothetical protein
MAATRSGFFSHCRKKVQPAGRLRVVRSESMAGAYCLPRRFGRVNPAGPTMPLPARSEPSPCAFPLLRRCPCRGNVPARPRGGTRRAAAGRSVLRGSECLEPDSARGFVGLDDRHLLIDAGRNRYLIQVAPACWISTPPVRRLPRRSHFRKGLRQPSTPW